MDIKLIKKLIVLMQKSEMTEFKYRDDDFYISLKKEQLQVISSVQSKSAIEKEEEIKKPSKEKELIEIKSPMVGTFYCSPSPGAPPYVEQGQDVKKGDVLCIVEAMKVMNEIEAEFPCIIKKVMVKDAQRVEYGTTLFLVKKA
ncbi:MAG: acetyl-CoA carboxylase biotin carboxyl carrier protein [Desulfurellaceae bacterium]|jgi:acetyl-CoA carboxylase biotin carboxyl carrier protein|nr:acetyl-CoA carboxylase biotin carboxyl carrier protein [Desulfurellaceae bacterium]